MTTPKENPEDPIERMKKIVDNKGNSAVVEEQLVAADEPAFLSAFDDKRIKAEISENIEKLTGKMQPETYDLFSKMLELRRLSRARNKETPLDEVKKLYAATKANNALVDQLTEEERTLINQALNLDSELFNKNRASQGKISHIPSLD